MLGSQTLWRGLGNILKGLGMEMAASFTRTIPEILRPGISNRKLSNLSARADAEMERGSAQVAFMAVNSLGGVMEGITGRVRQAFDDQMASGGLFSTDEERATIKGIFEELEAMLREAEATANENTKPEVGPGVTPEDGLGLAAKVMRPIVSSMGRIGGASLRGARPDQMDRERNRSLKQIERNTAAGRVAVYG